MKSESPNDARANQDKITQAEGNLMKAASEFGNPFGRDQTAHPRSYWVELHIKAWRDLAVAAVEYANCVDVAEAEWVLATHQEPELPPKPSPQPPYFPV